MSPARVEMAMPTQIDQPATSGVKITWASTSGPRSSAAADFPFKPALRISSSCNPSRGITRDSMPDAVPTNATRASGTRASSSRALWKTYRPKSKRPPATGSGSQEDLLAVREAVWIWSVRRYARLALWALPAAALLYGWSTLGIDTPPGPLVVLLVAGWLAGQFMRGGGYGIVGDIVLGIVGAIVGGFLASNLLNLDVTGINLTSILIAFLGACLVIGISRAFSGRRSGI